MCRHVASEKCRAARYDLKNLTPHCPACLSLAPLTRSASFLDFAPLHRPSNAQLANLSQDLFYPRIQPSLCILFPRSLVQILLHLCHPTVRFRAESKLDLYQRFETRVQVWNSKVDELRNLGVKLLVELLVGRACHFRFFLGAWKLRDVLVGLLRQFFHLGTERVVVEKFVVALLDTCDTSESAGWKGLGRVEGLAFVDVREVSAEPRNGLEHRRPVRTIQNLDGLSVKVFYRLFI